MSDENNKDVLIEYLRNELKKARFERDEAHSERRAAQEELYKLEKKNRQRELIELEEILDDDYYDY